MKVYKVTDFKKVDITRYIEGDIFYTDSEVGMLINGEIKKFSMQKPTQQRKKKEGK